MLHFHLLPMRLWLVTMYGEAVSHNFVEAPLPLEVLCESAKSAGQQRAGLPEMIVAASSPAGHFSCWSGVTANRAC